MVAGTVEILQDVCDACVHQRRHCLQVPGQQVEDVNINYSPSYLNDECYSLIGQTHIVRFTFIVVLHATTKLSHQYKYNLHQ